MVVRRKGWSTIAAALDGPATGRYIFLRAIATMAMPRSRLAACVHVAFRADRLVWEAMPLGETLLEAAPQELAVTAHGDAGQGGINCHLGPDVLRLRQVS
jgi:hypothetical protein